MAKKAAADIGSNGNFQVEKNIPVRVRGKSPTIYPWESMEVGDSFFAPGSPEITRSAASAAGRRFGYRFSCGKEGDGVRVWRTA